MEEISGCLFHCEEESLPLMMEYVIRQISATATVVSPYTFHEILHICSPMSSITSRIRSARFLIDFGALEPCLSRGHKQKSLKVLNHSISMANRDHLLEKKHAKKLSLQNRDSFITCVACNVVLLKINVVHISIFVSYLMP